MVDLQIRYSPDGAYIDNSGTKMQMVASEPKANVYLLGKLGNYVERSISKLGKFIEAQIPGVQMPQSELHYTMVYNPEHDEEIEKKWLSGTEGQKVPLISQYILIGKQVMAMKIDGCEFTDS